jgi:7-alpha-hydroxysteroid dehydrogenase
MSSSTTRGAYYRSNPAERSFAKLRRRSSLLSACPSKSESRDVAAGATYGEPFSTTPVDELEPAFHLNIAVPIQLVRLALPHLLERPGASVVNIVSGAINLQTREHLSSDASKGALSYATPSIPSSLGARIRVNGIMPGIVETEAVVVTSHQVMLDDLVDRTRMRRLGAPLDIGLAAVSLALAASSWITGVLLDVDGGTVGEMNPMFPDV